MAASPSFRCRKPPAKGRPAHRRMSQLIVVSTVGALSEVDPSPRPWSMDDLYFYLFDGLIIIIIITDLGPGHGMATSAGRPLDSTFTVGAGNSLSEVSAIGAGAAPAGPRSARKARARGTG